MAELSRSEEEYKVPVVVYTSHDRRIVAMAIVTHGKIVYEMLDNETAEEVMAIMRSGCVTGMAFICEPAVPRTLPKERTPADIPDKISEFTPLSPCSEPGR